MQDLLQEKLIPLWKSIEQLRITPLRRVELLSTHDQQLGGPVFNLSPFFNIWSY